MENKHNNFKQFYYELKKLYPNKIRKLYNWLKLNYPLLTFFEFKLECINPDIRCLYDFFEENKIYIETSMQYQYVDKLIYLKGKISNFNNQTQFYLNDNLTNRKEIEYKAFLKGFELI